MGKSVRNKGNYRHLDAIRYAFNIAIFDTMRCIVPSLDSWLTCAVPERLRHDYHIICNVLCRPTGYALLYFLGRAYPCTLCIDEACS